MSVDPELVTVFETKDESEAMVVHSLLTSTGLESLLVNLEAPQDVLPGVGGMAIRVPADEAEEARRVIEEYRNSPETEEVDEDESEEVDPGPEAV